MPKVWPPIGRAATDDQGDVVTALGREVSETPEHRAAIRSGALLEFDPLGVPRAAAAQAGCAVADLASRFIVTEGELVRCYGRVVAGDGGDGVYRGVLSQTAAADEVNKINGPNGYYVLVSGPLSLAGAGCVLDGTTDDSARLSTLFNKAAETGGAVVDQIPALSVIVGPTVCAVAETVVIEGNPLQGGLRVRGNGGRNPLAPGVTYIWTGAPGGVMFDLQCYGITWENARFTYAPGHAPLSLVNLGPGSSRHLFANCYFKSTAGLEPATYGLTTDVLNEAAGNAENVRVIDTIFEDFGSDCVAFLGNSQPFNWLFQECTFLQYGWPAYYLAASGVQKLRGSGIKGSGSYSFRMINCDSNACESVVRGNCSFVRIGGSDERCKMMYDGSSATGAALNQTIDGTRFGIEDIALESVGPRGIAAGVKQLVVKQELGTLRMNEVEFTGMADGTNGAKIVLLNGCGYIGEGNTYPNMQPFSGTGGTLDPARTPGGFFSRGDFGCSGAGPVFTALPPRTSGCIGHSGTFELANGDGTSKTITEADAGLYEQNAKYRVKLTPLGYTGSPSAGSLSWSVGSITASAFTVTFEAAVGSGATRTFHYEREPY